MVCIFVDFSASILKMKFHSLVTKILLEYCSILKFAQIPTSLSIEMIFLLHFLSLMNENQSFLTSLCHFYDVCDVFSVKFERSSLKGKLCMQWKLRHF